MGTTEDMASRRENPRVDTASRRDEVIEARKAIAGGLAVGGDPVLRSLSNSGVPTVVRESRFISDLETVKLTRHRV